MMNEITLVRRQEIVSRSTKRSPGHGHSGEFARIRITRVPAGQGFPEVVRQALEGAVFETFFTQEDMIKKCGEGLEEIVPSNTRLVYVPAVVGALQASGAMDEADLLKQIASDFSDMIAFSEDCFEII